MSHQPHQKIEIGLKEPQIQHSGIQKMPSSIQLNISNTNTTTKKQSRGHLYSSTDLPSSTSQSNNNVLPPSQDQKVDKTKYKTEMCKNWIEVNHCRYGNKCQFAHGNFELHGKAPPVNNNKYKSKVCLTFNERLFCPYGMRCLFKHEDRQMEEIRQYHYAYKLDQLEAMGKVSD